MNETGRYAQEMQRITDAILTSPGETTPELRQAIQARASTISSHGSSSSSTGEVIEDIPSELIPYIDTIALHAYKVTDEDMVALQQTGYSEDALFEITLSAALGTGLARMQYGLAALEENE